MIFFQLIIFSLKDSIRWYHVLLFFVFFHLPLQKSSEVSRSLKKKLRHAHHTATCVEYSKHMRYVNSRATVSCSVRWNNTVIFYSHYLFVHQNEKKSSCNNLYYLIVSKHYKVLPVLWQLLLERYCFNKSSLADHLRATQYRPTLKTDNLTYWKNGNIWRIIVFLRHLITQ